MPIPLKRVVLSTSALAVVAGPSIVAAQAATGVEGQTTPVAPERCRVYVYQVRRSTALALRTNGQTRS